MKLDQRVLIRGCPILAGWEGNVRARKYQGTGLILVELDEPVDIRYPGGQDRYFTFHRHELQVL